MFRELVRKNKQITNEESITLLKEETRGVLSVLGDNGYPYGMPMNHFYNDDDGCIYFHSGRGGHRLDSIKVCDKASFCVYNKGYRKENDWVYNVKSVIVFGKIDVIDDYNTVADICRKLSYKFIHDEEYIQDEISSYAHETILLKLIPEHICGKLVAES